ncbi:hypothetical protein PHET_02903 [Paragonimus heterotremus]|uniref:Uncharacterized protein n=1 Tax=Paragonimus heterotremus TaxID=100268 RepID=A0A8J4WK83_9TREM|nr:hypothetical protein PHET_02903 [Paragonimus heterotremus]
MDVTQLPHSPEARRLANVLHEASISNWNLHYLILIRGLPGSGKSTLAKISFTVETENIPAYCWNSLNEGLP